MNEEGRGLKDELKKAAPNETALKLLITD